MWLATLVGRHLHSPIAWWRANADRAKSPRPQLVAGATNAHSEQVATSFAAAAAIMACFPLSPSPAASPAAAVSPALGDSEATCAGTDQGVGVRSRAELTSSGSGRGGGSCSSKWQPPSLPKRWQHQRRSIGTHALGSSQSQHGVNGRGGGTASKPQLDPSAPEQNHLPYAQVATWPHAQRGGGVGGAPTEPTTGRKHACRSLPTRLPPGGAVFRRKDFVAARWSWSGASPANAIANWRAVVEPDGGAGATLVEPDGGAGATPLARALAP